MSARVFACLAAALLALGVTAGGSSSGTSALSGTLRVGAFTVPAGSARIVTGDLRIVAARDIRIAGTLLVAPGARVQLVAGHALEIARTGGVVPAARLLSHADNPPVEEVGPNDEYQASARVTIDGTILAVPGRSVKVSTAEHGTISVTGSILLTDGQNAGASHADGESGGSITIGGFFGRNKKVTIGAGASLVAGDGGKGFTDVRGESIGSATNPCGAQASGNRRALSLHGSDGGKGGTVRLQADELTVHSGHVQPGAGGAGGGAGSHTKAANGAPTHAGDDVVGVGGRGGDGGALIVDTLRYRGGDFHAGAGGDAGDVSVAAGNGAAGCEGGRTSVALDRPGRNGTDHGPHALPSESSPQAGTIAIGPGGDGGNAKDATHGGGDGGAVTIDVFHAKSSKPINGRVGPLAGTIAIDDTANGGNGFGTCPSSAHGTDGGAGGRLRFYANRYTADNSFDGRAGGSGATGGAGGAAGAANHAPAGGSNVFLAGKPGRSCSSVLGSGEITRDGCPDPHCVEIELTFDKPFTSFRFELPTNYGEANIAPPQIEGEDVGTCTLRPNNGQVSTVCLLHAQQPAGMHITVAFQAYKFGTDETLPDGAGGSLYFVPTKAESLPVSGPFKLVGP